MFNDMEYASIRMFNPVNQEKKAQTPIATMPELREVGTSSMVPTIQVRVIDKLMAVTCLRSFVGVLVAKTSD